MSSFISACFNLSFQLFNTGTLLSFCLGGDGRGGVDGAELVVVVGDLDLTLCAGDSRRGD